MFLHIFSDDVNCAVCIKSMKLSCFLIKVNNRFGLLIEHIQSFDYGLFVVIRSSTSLSSFKQSSLELLLSTFEVNNRLQIDPFRHLLLPDIHVLLSSWKSIKKISASEIVAFNFFAYQLDHEITRYQLSIFHYSTEFLSK